MRNPWYPDWDSALGKLRNIMSKKKSPELSIVKWRDTLHSVGWEKVSDPATDCPTLSSVGWVVLKDDETLKLATTLADDHSGSGILAIPMGCVVTVTKIKS